MLRTRSCELRSSENIGHRGTSGRETAGVRPPLLRPAIPGQLVTASLCELLEGKWNQPTLQRAE